MHKKVLLLTILFTGAVIIHGAVRGSGAQSAALEAVGGLSAARTGRMPENAEELLARQAAESARQAYQEWERNRPQMVTVEKPRPMRNGEEGILSYRWGMDFISVSGTRLLFSCDCYFPGQKLQQKIFYVAEGPDFAPREVFRQDSLSNTEGLRGKAADVLEYRKICPQAVEDGYVYEANGALYLLSEDFEETKRLCDLRKLMGELYQFSPWVGGRNLCDVSWDASRILACTDQGLYEYDLENGEGKLLEAAMYEVHEIIPEEGDCSCGETGFEFSGPLEAQYVPGGEGYVFMTGTEYGDLLGIVLRSQSGETLYQKQTEDYRIGFCWMESERAVYLAAFYGDSAGVWMDRVDVKSGKKETFAVPEEVFFGSAPCAGFLDPDHLVYLEQTEDSIAGIGIFSLSLGETKGSNPIPEKAGKNRVLALDLCGYDTVAVSIP